LIVFAGRSPSRAKDTRLVIRNGGEHGTEEDGWKEVEYSKKFSEAFNYTELNFSEIDQLLRTYQSKERYGNPQAKEFLYISEDNEEVCTKRYRKPNFEGGYDEIVKYYKMTPKKSGLRSNTNNNNFKNFKPNIGSTKDRIINSRNTNLQGRSLGSSKSKPRMGSSSSNILDFWVGNAGEIGARVGAINIRNSTTKSKFLKASLVEPKSLIAAPDSTAIFSIT